MSGDPVSEPGAGEGVLIVTPTYNELDVLQEFVDKTIAVLPGANLLIVDDASPDGTGALADRLASDNPRVHVLHRGAKLGLGTAYVEGFTWGLQRDYRLFFEMDADMSHDPKHLPEFLATFARGADVVIGSRNIEGGSVEGWGPGRHFLSKGGSLYAKTILGVDVSDLTTGFKGYTRRALNAIHLSSIRSNGYSFQVETTYRALLAGLDVREVPIVFIDRRVGQSKMSKKIFLEAVFMVVKLRALGELGQL